MKRDYYEILEIQRGASEVEIKAAYRKMALQFHPDRNPSHEAEDRFKEASEAYEILSDPQRRALYEQYGHAGLESRGFHGFNDVGDIFSHFSDVFEDFFGFGSRTQGRASAARPGRDLRLDLKLSFQEAFTGCEKKVELNRQETCLSCGGQGYPKDQKPIVCSQCEGKGQLYHSQGFFTISTTCGSCNGQGRVVKEHCGQCQGKGTCPIPKKLSVKVPAGVDTGIQLCIRGEGEEGRLGGRDGDLYIVLQVEEHPVLKREGDDLWFEKRISIVEASLGAEMEAVTPEGRERLKIPRGVRTGHVLKLKGMGMPHLHEKRRGDLLVQIFVETPQNLNARQEELLRAFQAEFHPASPKGGAESSFTKKDKTSKKSKKSKWF